MKHTSVKIQKRILALLSLLLGCLLLAGCAKSEPAKAQTFDFLELSGNLPLGWSVVSYENQYEAFCEDGVVTLSTEIADDVRLVHTVGISGGTKYVLSAEVATEHVSGGEGATLSIDNYSVDGSYLYSEGLYGNNAWTRVVLAFETDKKQDSVQLALRLGGYSSVSSGTARFRNLTLVSSDKADVSFQKLTLRSTSAHSDTEKSDEEYEAFFSLLFWATVIVAAALLFGVYRHWEELLRRPMDVKQKWTRFGFAVLIGLLIRLFLCKVFKGHATDIGCWVAWGNQIADGGFSTFYDGTWYDYPPGYMLILGGLTRIMRMLHVSEWGSDTLRLFWYMLPAFLCDIGCGALLVRFAEERKLPDAAGLLLGGLVVLNPAAVYLSGAWGQIDSILTLALLLTYAALRKNRRILAGLFYAVAILIKWQALIYGPVLGLVYVLTLVETDRKRRMTDLLKTVSAVLLAVAIIFAVSIPFRGSMGTLWIVERFLSASSGYDYATVEGYNFFALLGANWRNANVDLFNGANIGEALLLTLNTLGKLLLPTALVTLGIATVHDFRRKNGYAAVSALGTVSALCVLLYTVSVVETGVEDFLWTLYGAAALLGLIGWIALLRERKYTFRTLLAQNETVFYGFGTAALSAGLLLGTWLLWVICRIVGISLTYQGFGTLMIVLSLCGVLWLLWRYHHLGRLTVDDPEMIYLVSAMFMLWVFTFGQYMHERYVFPVLILLLFVYAARKDKRILLAALLLTISTFLNEIVAMYVVSDGAIHAIRGGETHNRFLAFCSAWEVLSTLFLTVTVVRSIDGKGGENA